MTGLQSMVSLLVFVVAVVFIGKLILRWAGRTVVKVYPVATPMSYPVPPPLAPPYPPPPYYPPPGYSEHYQQHPVDQRPIAVNEPLTEDERKFNEVVRDFYQPDR